MGVEIGKNAAEKSKGLFAAEDWQCSKCGNVNWARRSTCNVCNAPRVGDVEERTGLGGGFDERGKVEYNSHDSDNDEYDDFGRKKKKFRDGKSSGTDIKKTSDEKKPETDEEEEDDDDDLGKYNLWGDDEKDSKKDTTPERNKNNSDSRAKNKRRSRSRSRSRDRRRSRYSRSRSSSRSSASSRGRGK